MEKSIILSNDISEISKLNEFVEEIGNEFSLTPDVVFNLNLVLEEAVVNVINYAYPKRNTSQSIFPPDCMKILSYWCLQILVWSLTPL
jgi:serine/threonine-protein kinase RsbW